jgi:hypothetical protein
MLLPPGRKVAKPWKCLTYSNSAKQGFTGGSACATSSARPALPFYTIACVLPLVTCYVAPVTRYALLVTRHMSLPSHCAVLSLSVRSSSSMVGKLPFNFLGRAAVKRYSETPTGLRRSRSAYSATILFFDLQRMMPMLG